jgi:predicted negative regulator of RcsB-dependent stress response
MLEFSRLWNLEYLRPEDFDSYHADDGKEYPSLAEKVIGQASKKAAAADNVQDLNYIRPHIDSAIERFPDNIWLKLNKAKVLLALGKHEDALEFGLAVSKSKRSEYWAWKLLGDICAVIDSEAAFSCYCKALLCPTDDQYTSNLRLKLAQLMVDNHDLAAAKYEVNRVLEYTEKEGKKTPEVAVKIASQEWYGETQTSKSNLDYYKANVSVAEALLFSKMPWISANVGDKFTVPAIEGRKPKQKRKIFVQHNSVPIEVSISESRFEYSNLAPGDGLRLKGEFDSNKRFQIYVVENRKSVNRWDVFSEQIGVVDHVNKDRNVIHFIIDKEVEGVVSFAELADTFSEGDAIAVKLVSHTSARGKVFRVLNAVATDQIPSKLVKKQFCEEVRVSNGMGFTENDIFISPSLVSEQQIKDGQKISGEAVLNYNKKRENWGWKAITLEFNEQ